MNNDKMNWCTNIELIVNIFKMKTSQLIVMLILFMIIFIHIVSKIIFFSNI